MGRVIQAKSLFTTTTLLVELTKTNNFDHGKREAKEGCNDQAAEKGVLQLAW
jgi:hypothetical protein